VIAGYRVKAILEGLAIMSAAHSVVAQVRTHAQGDQADTKDVTKKPSRNPVP
jgi:hypothetical protein